MSERHRIFSSTKLSKKEKTDDKENIYHVNESKNSAGTNSQKIAASSKRFNLNDVGGPCYCKSNLPNLKSSTKKEPFKIHIDRTCNDLNNEASVRERMMKYDAYRIEREKFKKTTPLFKNKQKSGLGTNKQQIIKKRNECLQNSLVPHDKTSTKSVNTVSEVQFVRREISTTKSLVDLSEINKQSTLINNGREINLDLCSTKFTSIPKKQLSDKMPYLTSQSCFTQRTVFVTGNRRNSARTENEVLIDQQKQESMKSNKCKLFGGSKESLSSDICNILSSGSSKKQVSTKDLNKSKSEIISIDKDKYLKNQGRQELMDTEVQIRDKLNSEPTRQNYFSPYLLYDSDYFATLLTVEKEKEDNSPKLSPEFLIKYSNNQSRNIIVTFLLHFGTHCRYPSCIIYQAVKLFDVILDTIPIEVTDMHLVAVTGLWIILKKDGTLDKIPSAKSMLALIKDQQYSEDLLSEWERKILYSLKFNISFSDPFTIFIFYFINCNYYKISSNIISKIYYCGGYIIDLTLLDVNFSYATSNDIALAAAELIMCLVLGNDDDLSFPKWDTWQRILTNSVNVPKSFNNDKVNSLRAVMISHVLESEKKHTKKKIVRKKYTHSRYGNITSFLLEKIKKIPLENNTMISV